jgi:hypothetical protein
MAIRVQRRFRFTRTLDLPDKSTFGISPPPLTQSKTMLPLLMSFLGISIAATYAVIVACCLPNG